MPLAYVYTAFGGPENETFTDLPRPVPGPGQLLVAVRATAVNPVDWKRRNGYLPIGSSASDLPHGVRQRGRGRRGGSRRGGRGVRGR